MSDLGKKIKELRLGKKWSQDELANRLGMNRVNVSNYERGIVTNVPSDVINQLASIFDVTTDYLLGRSDKKYWDLNEKDQKDISKQLANMIEDLSNADALAFSKENGEMDDNTRELLIMSLENSLKIAKQESKKRFTPKKYRGED